MNIKSIVYAAFFAVTGPLSAQFDSSWTMKNSSPTEALVTVDILKDLNVLSAISKVFFFERVTTAVIQKSPASKKVTFVLGNSTSPVAIYAVKEDGGIVRVYHYVLDSDKKIDAVKDVWQNVGLGVELPSDVKIVSRKVTGNNEQVILEGDAIADLFKGLVARVILLKRDMTFYGYLDLKRRLESTYGAAKESAYFPSYAKDDQAKQTAIRVGSGRVFLYWDFTEWTAEFKWAKDVAGISFEHKELSRRFDATVPLRP